MSQISIPANANHLVLRSAMQAIRSSGWTNVAIAPASNPQRLLALVSPHTWLAAVMELEPQAFILTEFLNRTYQGDNSISPSTNQVIHGKPSELI